MNKYLISEGELLRHIKRRQHRAQVPPLVLFAIFFWCSLVLPWHLVFQTLSVISLVWYFGLALGYRMHQKILQPDDVSVYCPITGKVASVKIAGDFRLITVQKAYADQVELRCPKTGCYWDGDDLVLDNPRIRFTFEAKRVIRIPDAEMKSGVVIALMPGPGWCRIRTAENLGTILREHSACEAGETRITRPDIALD